MTTIEQAFFDAVLADISYVKELTPGLTGRDFGDAIKGRISGPLAQIIGDRFEVLDVRDVQSSGYQGVVFRDKITNVLYIANRGTEPGIDFIADGNLAVVSGVATAQAASMVNWWLQISNPAGTQVPLITANGMNQFSASSTVEATGKISAALAQSGGQVRVVGHSLGGHLTTIFASLFSDQVSHSSTFNGAGLFSVGTELNIPAYLINFLKGEPLQNLAALIGATVNLPESKQDNFYAYNGLNLTTNSLTFTQVGERIGLFNENSTNPINNHFMYKLTDSLALMTAIQRLDPTLSISTLNALFEASSNTANASNENLLDSLRRLFWGSDIEKTPIFDSDNASARTDYHQNLQDLQNDPDFTSLAGRVTIQLSSGSFDSIARSDFSAFLSLYNLSPVYLKANGISQSDLNALLGSINSDLYSQWQSDNALTAEQRAGGKANFSDTYLHDRAAMLSWQILANQADNSTVGTGDWVFTDSASNTAVTNRNQNSASTAHQVYFGGSGTDGFSGGSNSDHLYGGGGNDVLFGNAGDDYLEGNSGDDRLFGSKGNDTIHGGEGTDTYVYNIGDGNDIIIDSDNKGRIEIVNYSDFISLSTMYNIDETTWIDATGKVRLVHGTTWQLLFEDGGSIDLGADFQSGYLGINLDNAPATPTGSDTIVGDLTPIDYDTTQAGIQMHTDSLGNVICNSDAMPGRSDYLYDGEGNETVEGKEGNDTIYQGAGDDHILGGEGRDGIGYQTAEASGNDILEGGEGADILHGGDGNDQIFGDNKGEMADLIAAGETSAGINEQGDLIGGGTGNDLLFGTARNDALFGGGGQDLLAGGAGNDFIAGGGDYDGTIVYKNQENGEYSYTSGPAFNWTLSLNFDGDTYTPAFTNLTYYNSGMNDTSGDVIYAGAGNDFVFGSAGNDEIDGGDGDDVVYAVGGNNTVFGGAGNDFLSAATGSGDDGDNYIDGGDGNDKIFGSSGDDTLFGGSGDDELQGGDGENYLDGEAGNDTLFGGSGNDTLFGGDGDDYLDDTGGDNYLDGEAGNDTLWGGDGKDQLMGGNEDDELHGEAGDDYLDGGAENDRLFGGVGNDQLFGGDGNDELSGGDNDDYLDGETGDDKLFGDAGNNQLLGGDGNDQLSTGDGDDYLDGGTGDDILIAGAGNDQLTGGDGNDQLQGNAGNDYLNGEAGADLLFGDVGDDTLFGGEDNDELQGGDGNDYLDGGNGNDTLDGGAGNDILLGGDGDDWIQDSTGNNTLDGGLGNDTLLGGVGDDLLAGGVGDDTLQGDAGNDTYLFNLGDGQDTIFDLDSTSGNLDILRFGIGIAASDIALSREGYDIILSINGTSDKVRIQNWGSVDEEYLVERVEFADNTVWDAAYIRSLLAELPVVGTDGNDSLTVWTADENTTLQGLAGNDDLLGSGGNDIFIGGVGNDRMDGGGGDDLYLFNRGDGQDTIAEGGFDIKNDLFGMGIDPRTMHFINLKGWGQETLRFGADIAPSDITLSREGYDLILSINGTDDQVRVQLWGLSESCRIERVEFADNTVWDTAYIQSQLLELPVIGTAGNDNLYPWSDQASTLQGLAGNDSLLGSSGNDTLNGGTGNDSLSGGAGSDTYIFNRGDGQDTITETGFDTDILSFGADINASDISLKRVGKNLIFNIAGSSDQVTISSWANTGVYPGWWGDHGGSQIEQVNFADGTVWDKTYLQSLLNAIPVTGTDGVDELHPWQFATDTVLQGLGGNDILSALPSLSRYGYYWYLTDEYAFNNSYTHITMDGGIGNDWLKGHAGDDTYMFNIGGGQDVVDEHAYTELVGFGSEYHIQYFGGGFDTLQFGAGITASDISLVRSQYDLVLHINGTGDQVSLHGWGNNQGFDESLVDSRIEQVTFADSTVWSASYIWSLLANPIVGTTGNDTLYAWSLENAILQGMDGNDTLYGNKGNETLDGGLGTDTLSGDVGNDTYLFNLGDGQDTILENGGTLDILRFGAGITSGDITFSRSGSDLVLSITGGDQVTIQNWGASETARIDRIEFSGGAVWDSAFIQSQLSGLPILGTTGNDTLYAWAAENSTLQGLAGNDHLNGGDGNDTLIGGLGTDILQGGAGNDTYLFNLGDGQDIIAEGGGLDILRFGAGIASGDVAFSRSGYDLILSINGTSDQIKLQGWGVEDSYYIERVEFSGGTIWDATYIQSMIAAIPLSGTSGDDTLQAWPDENGTIEGLAGNDALYGNNGNDTLIGGVGNDALYGSAGNDTYVFNLGDGQDTIVEWGGNLDSIRFGAGIAPGDITFSRSGYDLIVSINGSSDQIKIQNWGSGNDNRIEQIEFSDATLWNASYIETLLAEVAMVGTENNDSLQAWVGENTTLQGLAGNDTLYGNSGNDILIGGAGDDTLNGGIGSDTYLFGRGAGHDTIDNYDIGVGKTDALVFADDVHLADIDINRRDTDSDDLVLTIRDSGDQVTIINCLSGNQFAVDVIRIPADNIQLTINDIKELLLQGSSEDDSLIGYATADTISGLGGNDTISGFDGNDTLYGGDGDDTLIGGAGDDILNGGAGSDTYLFGLGSGHDTINNFDISASKTDALVLGDGLRAEDIKIARTNDDLTIDILNSSDQVTIANYFSGDGLDGHAVEEIRIPADNLVYSIADIRQLVLQISDGDDTLIGYASNDTISGLGGNDFIDGRGGNDILNGGLGDDIIDGGTGADIMDGGLGNDTYRVDSVDDQIIEAANGGNDTVETGLTYTLGSNLENLVLTGTADNNGFGNNADNYLSGNSGNNILDGGLGADSMEGGDANDTYYTDNQADAIYEQDNAGIDTEIRSFDTDYLLASNIENLNLSGSAIYGNGNELDNIITGNEADNNLWGGAGNDTLIGGGGNDALFGAEGQDILTGGDGDDYYAVDDAGDLIIEATGEGDDFVRSTVSYTLSDNIERAAVDGMDDLTLTGNMQDNGLWGNEGNNLLTGGKGSDYLDGGAGNDIYVFNRGDGQDTINTTDAIDAIDTLRFGTDILDTDVVARRDGNNLVFTIKNSTDYVIVMDHFVAGLEGEDNALDRVEFANNVVWDAAMIQTVVDRATNNHAPTVSSFLPTLQARAGSLFTSVVPVNTITDPDSWDSITYSAKMEDGSDLPSWLSFDPVTRTFSGTPDTGNIGSLQFILWGTDNYGYAAGEYVTITIGQPNHAPTLATPLANQSGSEGLAFSYTVPTTAFSDSDTGDTLTYSATMADGSALPSWLSFNTSTRAFSGTPPVGSTGTISLKVTAKDTGNLTASDIFDLVVSVKNLTLTGTSGVDTLTGGAGNDILSGLAGNDRLVGNAGNDKLDGGTGNDTMLGGLGDDIYVVNSTSDVVTENANEGMDTVQSSVTLALAANVENLTLTGTTAINGTGNILDNVLTGNSGKNTLTGGAGNDTLNGGTGADKLIGGTGNDTYIVDNTGDVITENVNEGTDTVKSSVTLTLAANVENLTLTGTTAINGTGNTLDNVLTGNSGKNTLTGGAGNDTLNGGTGADKLIGGTGNDTYFIDNSSDTITENANGGTDTVNSSISYTLGTNLENLTLTGATAINGTGNTLDNVLIGNSAANSLTGGVGNDTLDGGVGNDTITGGTGNDTYTLGRGYGIDTVVENDTTTGNTDIARFNENIATDQLWFQHVGSNLEVSVIGTSDKFTIQNWYSGSQYHVEQFKTADGKTLADSNVEALVSAMASFAVPGSGQTVLPQNYQEALAPMIAANWQ